MGAAVDLRVPRSFWTRLAGKYGNQFYWKEQVRVWGVLYGRRAYERAGPNKMEADSLVS